MLHRIIRSITRSVHAILIGALVLGTIAPLQAQIMKQSLQGAGEAISGAASAVVGGVRYSSNWLNRKIESGVTQFPRWARQRVAFAFRRFAMPTAQEYRVMKKWVNRESLSSQERMLWNQYKKRVYSSRGAIATIVTIVIAILAAIVGTAVVVHKKREREAREKEEREREERERQRKLTEARTIEEGEPAAPEVVGETEEELQRQARERAGAAMAAAESDPTLIPLPPPAAEEEAELTQVLEPSRPAITLTPVPASQLAIEFSPDPESPLVGSYEAPPAALLASTINIRTEMAKLEKSEKMQQASAQSAQQYQTAMQAWGQRWQQLIARQPIEHAQEVFNVFKGLMERDAPFIHRKIVETHRQINNADRAFLNRYLQGDPNLVKKLQRILTAEQLSRTVSAGIKAGAQQKARVLGAAADEPEPDPGIIRSLVDSMLGRGGASAPVEAPAERQEPLVTQWGRLKASVDRYLILVRKNILRGETTQFDQMDQLRQLIDSLRSGVKLSLAEVSRISQDLTGFIGSGRKLQAVMADVMRTGGGQEITRDSLRKVVDANFQAIPDVFKKPPHNLSPETLYIFLGGFLKNPLAKNMGAIIERKIDALRKGGSQKSDLDWLKRQLSYYTDAYEKDRLDAYLGSGPAMRRLQRQEDVQLSEDQKEKQVGTISELIEHLQEIESGLRRS